MIPEQRGPIRVFLLDDHEIVRRGIKELLESEGDIEVVGESGLAQEAARRIPALRPDVAILDGRLPDGSGIDVCRQVRSVDPTIAGLILTSYDDDDALFAAIMAGAAGYILKQVGGNDLVETVRRVAAGQSTLDPSVTARVLDRLRNGPRVDPELDALSAQEQRILDLIGEGLTNREIAERMYLAEKTVKNYVSSMLAKLGLTSRTQAAIFATKHPTRLSPRRVCLTRLAQRTLNVASVSPLAVDQAGEGGGRQVGATTAAPARSRPCATWTSTTSCVRCSTGSTALSTSRNGSGCCSTPS